MIKLFHCKCCWKLVLFTFLVIPELVNAQQYFSVGNGDLVAGFRKTNPSGSYEMVSYLGNITNFLAIPAGNTLSITNYAAFQLSNSFSSFGLLEWSVFAGDNGNNNAPNSYWAGYALDTVWYTLPRSSVGTQTTPPSRYGDQSGIQSAIASIGNGAFTVSSGAALNATNNNAYVVREPAGGPNSLSTFIQDPFYASIGDFGGNLPSTVENTTPSTFTSAVVSDLYQSVTGGYNDPNTGMSTGNAYYVGYFTLNLNGTMTFTRASTGVAQPTAGFSGTPTSGAAPLPVLFTDGSTGSITNWVWSFGDGNSLTNSSNASVNHTYVSAGTYTVSLIVTGAGGSNTKTQTGYIVVTNAAPLAGFSGAPTNIFVTQSVVFTDTSTGSITNWVWNFGDGNSVTNTSSSNVTNVYATAGTYTVSLTVKGAGGSNTNTQANYIVVKPGPVFGKPVLSGSTLILSGVNGPAGQQYRILTSTNVALPLTNWTPVLTNMFASDGSYGYTNSTATNKAAFFILASP